MKLTKLVRSCPDPIVCRSGGVRRQVGTSAEMPQEPGQYHLLPGCARLMLLHERVYSGHPQPASVIASLDERGTSSSSESLKEDEPGILPRIVPNVLATR